MNQYVKTSKDHRNDKSMSLRIDDDKLVKIYISPFGIRLNIKKKLI